MLRNCLYCSTSLFSIPSLLLVVLYRALHEARYSYTVMSCWFQMHTRFSSLSCLWSTLESNCQHLLSFSLFISVNMSDHKTAVLKNKIWHLFSRLTIHLLVKSCQSFFLSKRHFTQTLTVCTTFKSMPMKQRSGNISAAIPPTQTHMLKAHHTCMHPQQKTHLFYLISMYCGKRV